MFKYALVAMFVVMFTLKLMGTLTVSWWVVTSPIWGTAALGLLIGLGILVYMWLYNRY